MKNVGNAIGIMFLGAAGGYLVKAYLDTLITGTSIGENICTYLIPLGIFVACIALALFTLFGRHKKRE